MSKLLSSAALALVLAMPGWALASGESAASDEMNTETESSASGTTATGDESMNPEDSDTAATDEEIPEVSESQPGTVTGEDVQVDEDQPDAGSGTTE